ncbi:MAG: helix-turn-helix domain-containing protein [Rhodospirillales bacterium]
MVVKLSEGVLSGKALPADEAEEEVTAALRDVSSPPWAATIDAFVATLKQALRSLRTARGMTQGALADSVGVSTSTISRLEGDAATPVDLAMLGEILHHLNVGLRCELLVDGRSMEVAVRPAADGERRPADDRRALSRHLRDLRQRIEAIEHDLGADPSGEGEASVEVVPVGYERYRPVARVTPLPKGYRRLAAEPVQALRTAQAKIDEGLTIMRAAVAASGKKSGSAE